MWCENICNVCYFVPRFVVYLYFKEVVLGWKFFPWLVTVFLCSGSEGPDTPGYMPDSPDSLTGVSGLLPGVSGSCWQTDFFKWIEWITCHLHHTCLALTWSPHCKTYKSFYGYLDIYAKIVGMSSQNWNSKFMAYIKGELLYAICLSFYVNQMSYMWVVINHQKGGRLKVI